MKYEGAVYRPPSEARSLIIQVTIGCTHNQCTFCSMYKSKHFRMRSREEIFSDLNEMSERYGSYPLRIFLADGDAMALKTDYLLAILQHIQYCFPKAERVTAYGRASDINRKSVKELQLLRANGLTMIYMGAESGDETILKQVHKGLTRADYLQAVQKLKASSIMLSVTFISGLGGKERLMEHALASADLVTAMRPEYVGFLTLMLENDLPIMNEIRQGRLTLLKPQDVASEMQTFLKQVDSPGTVFRSNHASNYINLRGTLNADIPHMLAYLDEINARQLYRPEDHRLL